MMGEFEALLGRLDSALPKPGLLSLEQVSRHILSKIDDGLQSSTSVTGLIVGYVQSGKTLSFTAVTALAADFEYSAIIVIGGTKVNLFKQSNDRLQRDLNVNRRSARVYKYFENPRLQQLSGIESALDSPRSGLDKRIALITVQKQVDHLSHLIELLSQSSIKKCKVLVIDDEADQAGLNTRGSKGEESSIYGLLTELRRRLGSHGFLQYTATPQAPLLINLIDALSPDFPVVLPSSAGYCGGRTFFIEHPDLVETIPLEEIPISPDDAFEPPESLQVAMRLFFLGVSCGMLLSEGTGNRAMLVHPSQLTAMHDTYLRWVKSIRQQWLVAFTSHDWREADADLISSFRNSFRALTQTVSELPDFELVIARLGRDIADCNIQLVNSTNSDSSDVNWANNYAHILVGGQAMDRGFTVEGLTITYMPRGRGVGNADTIQQRARFFGYKGAYLGFCRVFLELDVQ